MLSNYDTVTVLFQEKPEVLPSKPKTSDVCIHQSEQSNKLSCQELRLCNRGKKELILWETFTVSQEKPNLPRVNRDIDALNYVLSVVRSARNLRDADDLIPTWIGCLSLLSDKTLLIWQVVFLPYLPNPVTKYDTVFNALFNLANVANQLQQHCHPAFCNEGVFCIVTEIFLKQPEHLLNLVPMMDGFHMTKSSKHCVGKYLRGSGMEDVFVRNRNIWTKSCTVSKGRITLCQSFQGHVYCCRSSWVNEMGCLFECS